MPLKLKKPRPGKTPFYYIRGTHIGVRLDESTGFTSEAKARQALIKRRAEIERNALSGAGRGGSVAQKEKTFVASAVAYIEAGGDGRFLGSYDEDTGKWDGPIGLLGNKALSEIDQATIDSAANTLYPNAAPATKNRQLYTPVSAVMKHAGDERKFKRPKGSRGNKRTDWLTPEQAFALFKATDERDKEFGIFLRFLCYTGSRLSEALNLTCDRLHLSEAFAYVSTTKNSDPRALHLPPIIVAALGNHPRGTDRGKQRVFRLRKHGRLYIQLHGHFKRAGITLPKRTAFHVLRHTWATWMRRYAGLDTRGLVGTGAWRDMQSVVRYTHVVASEESRRANLLPVERAWKRKIRVGK